MEKYKYLETIIIENNKSASVKAIANISKFTCKCTICGSPDAEKRHQYSSEGIWNGEISENFENSLNRPCIKHWDT